MSATAEASPRTRVAELLKGSPGVVPCTVALGVLVWFAADEGGFRKVTWMPATLLLAAVLLVCLAVLPRPRPARLALAAVLLLAAYGGFCLLSMLWAGQEELAWDAGNRTLLYAIVLALCTLWPLRGRSGAVLLGAYGLAIAAIAFVELIRVAGADQAIQFFEEGRFAEPVGYANANVALWMSGLLPCAILAGRREVPVPLRGLLLGAAGILSGAALLGQSRGWLFALPLAGVVALLVVPGRARTIAAFGAVALGLLVFLQPVLDVYSDWRPFRPPGEDYDTALRAILVASVALAVVGTIAALVDRRVELSEQRARQISTGTVVALVAGVVLAVVGFAVVERSPVSAASDAWSEFKHGGNSPEGRGSRLTSGFSTYRWDYWVVGWGEFKEAPLVGAGADNFGRAYRDKGNSGQTPLYPHSTEMVALAETGLIGALLLGGAFVTALLAALRGPRRSDLAGVAAGAGVLVFAYWFLHSSVDWLWEFPGLAGAALAALGIATAVNRGLQAEEATSAEARRPILAGGPALALGLAGAVALTVSIVPPWFAEREQQRGIDLARSDPAAAIRHFERAADWNPLTPVPYKAAGIVEVRQRDYGAATRQLQRALERDPDDSAPYLFLGAIASAGGRKQEALSLVEKANRLAPRDHEVAAHALYDLRHYGKVTPPTVDKYSQADRRNRAGRD
jgi:O-antigen ligase/polysaccharide polymerase Wzy-like membrane protein/tetratricopeptide repeat protein